MKTCENCGTKMQGGKCPNCHEELMILDQYAEQGMKPPKEDSKFMQKARKQREEVDLNYDFHEGRGSNNELL